MTSDNDESEALLSKDSSDSLPFLDRPELIFGLVGPIGVDLDFVTKALSASLDDVGYEAHKFKITELMREVSTGLPLDAATYISSIRQRIDYANKVREFLDRNDALAILAVSAIREFREEKNGSVEEPLTSTAFIINQFKRPEEVKLLRSIYGKQFVQISVHAPEDYRVGRLADKELNSQGGLIKGYEAKNNAYALVKQDEKEGDVGYGQNVRDAFPLADVVIEASINLACKATLERFVRALFGDNSASPTHDEYGMYMAKSASLRSSALTRQVGAAIFRDSGEIISMGCNEVPKSGGGTYWSGDEPDRRDFVEGIDPNERKKKELLIDLFDRLKKGDHLSGALSSIQDSGKIVDQVLISDGVESVKESKVMDLIEFGRDIHAEMSAISDAGRKGLPVQNAILYCTTFPCHICAKHIIAVGIKRIVYLEPYPKSYAEELHSDAIDIEGDGSGEKVGFQRFIGISPYRYRDLFEKGKRKYTGGIAQEWHQDEMRPMVEILFPSYFKAETHVVNILKDQRESLSAAVEADKSQQQAGE